MRVLAVDPGEKRIGLAVSDELGVVANPLMVIKHVARAVDVAQVVQVAVERGVGLIIIGESFDDDGNLNLAGRRAHKFATALREQIDIPVEMWDESFTTQDARAARLAMGVSRKKRAGHMDELAATVLLQDYLNSKR